MGLSHPSQSRNPGGAASQPRVDPTCPLVYSAPRPAPSPPQPDRLRDRLLHPGAAARLLLHPRSADPWQADPGRRRPLHLLYIASFEYSPAVDGCTRWHGGAAAAVRPEATTPPDLLAASSSIHPLHRLLLSFGN
jgi:hypothetical protein